MPISIIFTPVKIARKTFVLLGNRLFRACLVDTVEEGNASK